MHLRLLATTDLHCHIWPYDYDTDSPRPGIGLAALSPLIGRSRRECPNTLLLDNGDLLQGNALADHCAAKDRQGARHPIIAAMNMLGYDAATVGNHDFNYGLSTLRTALREATFPFVCANIVARGADAPFLPPSALLERILTAEDGQRHSVKIGIVGAAPPQIVQWDAATLDGALHAEGIVASISAEAANLRAAGADLVIALCHSGPGDGLEDADAENAALALARTGAVDVIVAGHSHRLLPGPAYAELPGVDGAAGLLADTPTVMAGAYGAHLGVIDLRLVSRDDCWQVGAATSALRAVSDHADPPDQRLLDLSRTEHEATRQKADMAVGTTLIRLHEAVALVGHSPALEFVATAQRWRALQMLGETAKDMPILSAAAPFRAGSSRNGGAVFTDVPPGPLRQAHLSELSPFPNQLVVIEVSGAVLRDWLDRSAAIFQTIAPGSHGGRLLFADAPGYNFDVIYGVRYEIDVSVASRFHAVSGIRLTPENDCRIRNLTRDGRPVEDADRFVVATNSYRVSGGGHFDMVKAAPRLATAAEPLRETLEAFVRANGPVDLPGAAAWSFTPVGADAVFPGPANLPEPVRANPAIRLHGPGDNPGSMSYLLRV